MLKTAKILGIAAVVAAIAPALAFADDNISVSAQANVTAKVVTKVGTAASVSSTSITLTGNDGTTYTVDLSSATAFYRFGEKMSASDIQQNDSLQVRGAVTGTTIAATRVRDLSQQRGATFVGTVSNPTSTGFTLQTKERSEGRADQTVKYTSATVFMKNGKAAQMSDVTAGIQVRVSGVWDRANNSIAAAKVNIVMRSIRISGTITAISGSTLTVTTSSNVVYMVDASSARLVRLHFGKSSISEFSINDKVQVSGKYIVGSTNITATSVRDLTITVKGNVSASSNSNSNSNEQ